MSLLVAERDSGTLAWTDLEAGVAHERAVSKWLTASAMLFVAAVLVPVLVTAAIAWVLYGPLDPWLVIVTIVALEASVVLFTRHRAGRRGLRPEPGRRRRDRARRPVRAIDPQRDLGTAQRLHADLDPELGTPGLGPGQGGSIATPIAWLVSIGLIVAVAARRMQRMEF